MVVTFIGGFELTTLVVIGTDCTDSCKSNYHTIMTTTAPVYSVKLCDKSLSVNSTQQLFPLCTFVSSPNKTDHHDITEILLDIHIPYPFYKEVKIPLTSLTLPHCCACHMLYIVLSIIISSLI